ncbi:hypothetical protein N0O92_00070 [Alkalihalobacillus sp. MEB130]|uniref:hypothetical protein n=1 Tax=Alkalihalobacillus sp. MEB130 TaxID=2976704 RepID=UPI0028DDFE5F|nr:hypothetical protein [Alkalihalobacillus sp. MEB130]MDT8858602.1 hypothetical protein [Alkalihalobacillus sp. MEB130]
MIYRAKEPKFLWILLFVLTITYAYALESTTLTYVAYGISFIFFAAMTMSYQVEVLEEKLIHVVQVFGFSLLKRTIPASTIDKVTVIYLRERAIILLTFKRKMRMKLQRFTPEGLESTLIEFANSNNIEVINRDPLKENKRSN